MMRLKLLKLIFRMGNVLAITPSRPSFESRTSNPIQKLYAVCMLTLITICTVISSIYKKPYYSDFKQIKLIVSVLTDIIAYWFSVQTILGAAFLKTRQWHHLLRQLKTTDDHQSKDKPKSRSPPFWREMAVLHLLFFAAIAYNIVAWVEAMGTDYFKQYTMFLFQFYCQFFYTLLLSVFLRLLLARYQHLNRMIDHQLDELEELKISAVFLENFHDFLRKVERYNYYVKDLVDIFNDIFGLPMLLIIFYSGALLLGYLDTLFKGDFGIGAKNVHDIIASNVVILVLSCIAAMVIILLCDAVLDEARVTIALYFRLQRSFGDNKSLEWKDVDQLILLAQNHFPSFTAGDYFIIDKTTVVDIMSTIITYLIVTLSFTANVI